MFTSFHPMKWLFALLLVLFIPSFAWANSLTIVHVDPPDAGTPAEEANISVYFDLRQGDQMAITGINQDNCSLFFEGKQPEVIKHEVVKFNEGNRGVGVLFIFPVAKNYTEDSFGIRATLSTLVQLFNRDIDMLNAIPYDISGTPVGWTKASESTLSRALGEMKTTEVLEPNLFASFQPAISVLDNLANVDQKYVVIISDAEGAIVGNQERALQLIGAFTDQLKKSHITPIVVGYSPDGAAAMTNVSLIKRIATNTGGPYFQAESLSSFQQVIQRDVFNYIFDQYIYRATLKMDGDNYLDPGKYTVQLVVKTNNSEDKATYKITWPELKKNLTWLWILIGSLVLVGGIVAAVIIVRRRMGDNEPEIDDTEPQDVCCPTCGKVLPLQLYGFNGEFCLSGGLPDCPYYKMPDRGKIQITRGPMADTTFFIKKDMTTIGSYPENDIFLADKTVSRKHAAIKTDEGKRYEIRDFGSANGLYINNEKIERKFLKDGDLIRFGTVETVFKLK